MILPFQNKTPQISPSCFIATQAVVIGDVEIGENSSVWFQTVIRGDVNQIRIGQKTNIQDLSMVHVNNMDSPQPSQIHIGDEVTVGHRVILHGCTIEDRCLIGMGSIIMDEAVIGAESIIGANSLITSRTKIPPGHLVMGSPAKVVRPLTEQEKAYLPISAEHYANLAKKYQLK